VSDRIFWRGFPSFKQAALKWRNIPAQGPVPWAGMFNPLRGKKQKHIAQPG